MPEAPYQSLADSRFKESNKGNGFTLPEKHLFTKAVLVSSDLKCFQPITSRLVGDHAIRLCPFVTFTKFGNCNPTTLKMNYNITSFICIPRSLYCFFQIINAKFMGDNTFQFPSSACHDFLHIPYIHRHISARAYDTLL